MTIRHPDLLWRCGRAIRSLGDQYRPAEPAPRRRQPRPVTGGAVHGRFRTGEYQVLLSRYGDGLQQVLVSGPGWQRWHASRDDLYIRETWQRMVLHCWVRDRLRRVKAWLAG